MTKPKNKTQLKRELQAALDAWNAIDPTTNPRGYERAYGMWFDADQALAEVTR